MSLPNVNDSGNSGIQLDPLLRGIARRDTWEQMRQNPKRHIVNALVYSALMTVLYKSQYGDKPLNRFQRWTTPKPFRTGRRRLSYVFLLYILNSGMKQYQKSYKRRLERYRANPFGAMISYAIRKFDESEALSTKQGLATNPQNTGNTSRVPFHLDFDPVDMRHD